MSKSSITPLKGKIAKLTVDEALALMRQNARARIQKEQEQKERDWKSSNSPYCCRVMREAVESELIVTGLDDKTLYLSHIREWDCQSYIYSLHFCPFCGKDLQ